MRRLSLILAVIMVCSGTVWAIGYHGERDFDTQGSVLPPIQSVVANARSLTGTPYDPLMGQHENIGATWGFIVCSDVPNIAYGLSGFSLKRMLEEDFQRHSDGYDTAQGNKPGNPYFHRRARNLYAYFKANGRLYGPSATPQVGDLAFYRRSTAGPISHVALVIAVHDTGYSLMESAPKTVLAQEVADSSPKARGWILAGFGRMYAADFHPLECENKSTSHSVSGQLPAVRRMSLQRALQNGNTGAVSRLRNFT